ncbi:response regulator [Geomonas terrae]|uniref:histidine kinase n=1 Tax=Geomonas terrae TaxID=2562681 RepID=A0A4S1CD94_9BACT|nr:ATP-binding protein [Geomonas terrae]TGU71361.1 response regulator [Geomonas terrae]
MGLESKGTGRPSPVLSVAIFLVAVGVMAYLRLFLFRDTLITLTYGLPLLPCLWHRDLRLLWSMAGAFTVLAALKAFWVLPDQNPEDFYEVVQWSFQVTNIVAVGVAIHMIIRLTERLAKANRDLAASNTELEQRAEEVVRQNREIHEQAEELTQQNEELTQQTEELTQQSEELQHQEEELRQQAEELQAQSEELRSANDELQQRESMLGTILASLRGGGRGERLLDQVCNSLLSLLGETAGGAAIVQASGESLLVLSHAGWGELTEAQWTFDRSFASVIMERDQTGYVDDLAARPDLIVPSSPKRKFRSILATPLRVDGRPVGAVEAYAKDPQHWTEEHFRIIEWVAAQCTVVIERTRAEESLRDSEAKLKAALHSMTDAVLIADVDGRIVEVNDAFATFHRFESKEECTRRLRECPEILDVFLGDSQDPAPPEQLAVPRALRGEQATNALYSLHRRDTGDTWMGSYSFGPILDAADAVVGSVVVARDVTEQMRAIRERQHLESQLFQSQKMESVGRLAGGVAHDFNNMLVVILGNAELALSDVDPASSIRERLQEIVRAAERSADITRQLLAFARKQTIAPKVLDLNATLEPMLMMIRRLIGEDIDLAWKPARGLWRVKIDPGQLDQLLANLATNARDAIGGVGKVEIETGNASIDEEYCAEHPEFTSGEYVTLTVSDDGRGIAREKMSSIFEPFYTTKDVGKGTGLGLATVFGIVKQNGGFINVYSEPGEGATFRIYLPRAEDDAPETEHRVVDPGRGTETVLIVEDEEANLHLLENYLRNLGYRVLAAATPGEALALAEGEPVELVVTDVVMPQMNGRDLANRLITSQPGLKFIFMSGYTADVIAHRGVLDEGVNFVQKPYALRELGAKIRSVLDNGGD